MEVLAYQEGCSLLLAVPSDSLNAVSISPSLLVSEYVSTHIYILYIYIWTYIYLYTYRHT